MRATRKGMRKDGRREAAEFKMGGNVAKGTI